MYTQKHLVLLEDKEFKELILLEAVRHAQVMLNVPTDEFNIRIKMKAAELLNQPEAFRDRLAYSVVSSWDFSANTPEAEGELLRQMIPDIFDAIAGQGI